MCGQHGIEDHGRHLSMPFRGEDLFCLLNHHQTCRQREEFFDAQGAKGYPNIVKLKNEADHNSDLRQLICHGIKSFAQIADHVEASGDPAVDHIREARKQQKQYGRDTVSFSDIYPYEHRDKKDTE